MKKTMKKSLQTFAGASTVSFIGMAAYTTPARAWAFIDSAAAPLTALPGGELMLLGLIGLCGLGLARQRAAA